VLSSRYRGESRALLTAWRRATAPFGDSALSLGVKICSSIAVLSLAAIAVRAMPWALDARVGWSSIGVFARGLVLVAAETSVVLGWPIAATLVAAAANDRGECAACLLTGVSPREIAARIVPAGIVVMLPVVIVASIVGDARPGSALTSMVDAAQRACDPPRRTVAVVPMTEAAWLCREGASPVLTLATRALVRTSAVQIDDDVRTVRARDVAIDMPGPPAVHVSVRDVTFRGLPPIARSRATPAMWRTMLVCVAALLGAWSSTSVIFARLEPRRWVAVLLGAATSASTLVLLGTLEKHAAEPGWYALLLIAALAPSAIAQALFTWFSGSSARRASRSTSPSAS
jgi:hypothetical protein